MFSVIFQPNNLVGLIPDMLNLMPPINKQQLCKVNT